MRSESQQQGHLWELNENAHPHSSLLHTHVRNSMTHNDQKMTEPKCAHGLPIQWDTVQPERQDILTHATISMNPESIMLSEVTWTQKDMLYDPTYRRYPEQSHSQT